MKIIAKVKEEQVQNLFCNEQDEQNSDQEVSEPSPSTENTVELEDEESSSDLEFVNLETAPQPTCMMKHRVPPPSAKGRYSLHDRIVAPQHLQ